MLRRRSFQVLLAVASLLALAGPVVLLAARSASPSYRVWSELPLTGVTTAWKGDGLVARRPAGLDPWGRPWARHRLVSASTGQRVPIASPSETRSIGPDGLDSYGGGDDVAVDGRMELVQLAPLLGVVAAGLVLWLVVALRSLGSGRGPEPWHDAVRAGVAATVPAAGVALAVAARGVPGPLGSLQLLVPAPVALVGAAWLVLTLAILYWRVRPGVPRRRKGSEERLAAGLVALAVAGLAVRDGLGRHTEALRQRRRFALARFGARSAVEGVLRGDTATLRAYLALEPDVEWERLSEPALIDLARVGPQAAPFLARAQGGDWAERRSWALLRGVDPRLGSLGEAFVAEPERYTDLLLVRPRLMAALAGVDAARGALRDVERAARRTPEGSPGPRHAYADEVGPRALEAMTAIAGEGDAWLVVEATPGCECALDGERPRAVHRSDPGFLIVGPVRPAPAGRTLTVFDRRNPGGVAVELPPLRDHHTLWLEVNVETGAFDLRPCARPAVR